MKAPSLVSVVIPTFKRSDFLVTAINSVLNQTYSNIEIIIVDDNDGDNEYRKITKQLLADEFPGNAFTYIEHDNNKGLAAARNSGIKVAKGEYLAFLDDDDYWYPEKIAKQIALFESLDESYGIVACYWKTIDTVKNTESIRKIKQRGDLTAILGLNHYAPPSMIVVKRSYLDMVNGFDDNFRWRQDIELYYRLAPHCKFDFVEEVLVDYYKHAGQMSNNLPQKLQHVQKFIAKHHNVLKNYKLPWSELHEHLGDLYAYNGFKREAAGAYIEALKNRPGRKLILLKLPLTLLLSTKQYRKIRKRE